MDKFKAMTIFVEVARQGSMSAAARRLGVVNSVVSKNLGELESWLHKKLILRSTRSLRLTADGEQFLEECQRILNDIQALESQVVSEQREITGTVRITAPLLQGRQLLAPALSQFRVINPKVELNVILDNDHRSMIDDGFDIAFRVSDSPDSSMISREICRVGLKLVASPAYIELKGTPHHPKEISGHECILEDRGQYFQRWRFIGKNGRQTSVTPTGSLRINDPELIVELSKQGQGLAHLPDSFVDADIAGGELVELLPDYRFEGLSLQMLYHGRNYRNEAARALIEFLVRYFH